MQFRTGGLVALAALALAWIGQAAQSQPVQDIRLALQAGGTAAWEVAAMQALHLDQANGIRLQIRSVADSKAAQVALQAGAVDVILSDFVWTSLQRQQGADFTFVPHSLAVGGVMIMPGGKVKTLADLKGATLAVAGGPVDKSFLILRAWYAARIGGDLTRDVTTDFAAPPLVNALLTDGQADASLNFWQFNTRSQLAGAMPLLSVPEMLRDLGVPRTPPLLGWVFSEAFAAGQPEVIKGFLDASFQTKQALRSDDALWDQIRPAMLADDDALFGALREGYRAGIVTSYTDADIAAAHATYALLAGIGGADLTGDAAGLAEGTFWAGYRK